MKTRIFPSLSALALLTACAQSPELVPAQGAQGVPGKETAAMASAAGVQVVANPKVWPGEAPISLEVRPLRVTIENKGPQPILVRYSQFTLTAPGGKTRTALPPVAFEGTVSRPVIAPGYAPVVAPGFTGTGFALSSWYGTLYPGYPLAAGTFPYDPGYFDTYGHYWVKRQLPTPDMLRLALPEGRLEPGGKVEGFIYFEKFDKEPERLDFRMNLVDASGRRDLGTVQIPFQARGG